MASTLAGRRVSVGRLRIRGRGGDALRLQLGVDRLLASADVRPARLPPAAILVVRSLVDPLPGGLDPRATVPSTDWQRAVATALDDRLARAARPAAGGTPADAESVMFADRAELLACLARDWCGGSLGARWWWRALGMGAPAAVLRAFAETPEAVPAALERLVRMGAAGSFAGRVPPSAAAALARSVARVFGAEHAVEAALAEPVPPIEVVPGVLREHGREVRAPRDAAGRAPRAVASRAPPPWHSTLPPPAAVLTLAPEQEVLLGIGLTLRRAAARVRAPAFARAARAWRATVATGERLPAVSTPAPPPSGRASVEQHASAVSAPPRPRAEPAAPVGAARPLGPERSARSAPRVSAASIGTSAAPASAVVPAVEPAGALATVVETRLGGLFHLVLVGQLLGLYADFTAPLHPGIALDVWDFVALLGRRLLGRPPRDPVWALLAELARRAPDEPPGEGFRPPRAWRVPRPWLAPFPPGGTWRYGEVDGRLVVRHPAGFPVVEAAGASLDRELARYRVARAREATWRCAPEPLLDRWVGNLARYVRARLALALGVPPREAARLALRRPARVFLTDTRVDVVSSLADLPIEVRLAGLDRDPGHVPAAGRAVAFHFE